MELEIKFDRVLLKRGFVSIKDFVFYATRIQNSLDLIGRELFPDISSDQFSLLIKERKTGSEIYKLVPRIKMRTFGELPVHEAITLFSDLSLLLETDQDGSNYKEVKEYIKNATRRRLLFNQFHSLSRHPNAFSVRLKKTADSKPKTIFFPRKKYRKSINSWKEMEIKKRQEEFIGALTKIQIEGEVHFKIRDIFGNAIKYRFMERETEKYRKFFTEIVKVRGLYNPVRDLLETIENIKLHNEFVLYKVNEIILNYPLSFKVKFMEDAFFIFNEELNLRGVGKTFKEMYEDLQLDILSAYNLYITSGKDLTPAAEKIKNELKKLIKTGV